VAFNGKTRNEAKVKCAIATERAAQRNIKSAKSYSSQARQIDPQVFCRCLDGVGNVR
jgi:hypothetical protein